MFKTTLARMALLATAPMLMVTGVLLAEPAHADEVSFLSDMEAAGFHNGSGNGAEIAVGHGICADVASGKSRQAVIQDLWLSSKLEQDEAVQFVNIALRDLCPAYAGSRA